VPADYDLPDPRPREPLSREQLDARRWELYRNVFAFATLYACLHKVLIPLFLSETSVTVRAYARVDAGFIPGVLLLAHLWRARWLGRWGSVLAGALVAYAVWEAREIGLGHHQGWLAWSHVLSSLPQGFLSVLMLSFPASGRRVGAAWMGAGVALVILGATAWWTSRAAADSEASLSQAKPGASSMSGPATDADECGRRSLVVDPRTTRPRSHIEIRSCGFYPAHLEAPAGVGKLRLRRHLVEAMNLRVVFYGADGARMRQKNRVLKFDESDIALGELTFGPGETMALLFSDAKPALGQVLVFAPSRAHGLRRRVVVGEHRQLVMEGP
jgi:hypothetical protein